MLDTEVTENTEEITQEAEIVDEPTVEETEVDSDVLEVEAALAEKEAEFTPDYKFSSYGQDHEIPEFARPLIKDPETEKTVKEIFNKAQSFDIFKEKDEKRAKTLEELQTKYEEVNGGISAVKDAIAQNNWDKFLQSSGIDENWIYNQVLNKVNYNEATPEQKAQMDAQRAEQDRFYDLEAKTKTLEQQTQEATIQAKRYELETVLATPDVRAFQEAFDSAPGKQPGAFREVVIDQAELAWTRGGGKVDVSLDQAARQAMSLLGNGYLTPPQDLQSGTAQNQVITETMQTQPTAKTIIPNVKGKASASPLKGKAAKSIADLKKLYNDKYVKQLA